MDPLNKTLQCNFCGKNQPEVKRLLAGPMVFICDECVTLCASILCGEDDTFRATIRHMLDVPTSMVTVPSTILQDMLSSRAQHKVKELLTHIQSRILFTQNLRKSLGFSDQEFIDWLLEDEFEGLPKHVPRNTLSLAKILSRIDSEGGKITVTIERDNGTTSFTYP